MITFPNNPDSYVYTYASSLDSKIFYVGKGRDERYLEHVKQARRKDILRPSGLYSQPSRVVAKVRLIWRQGGKVIIRKPYNNLPENDALDTEKSLIAYYATVYGYNQLVNSKNYTIPEELIHK